MKPDSESNSFWNYHPELPLKTAPYFDQPFNLKRIALYWIKGWRPLGTQFLFLPLALLIWAFFTPDLTRTQALSTDWILEIFFRNLVLIITVAGGLHLWLHTFNRQGTEQRYDKQDLGEQHNRFLFNDQLKDNLFWTLCSAVPIWTAWECLLLWAYANNVATLITFESNPIWFVVLLLLVPYWALLFFDIQHRLMHRDFLYRHVHHWHHKNATTGPWSGLAMHPIEHLVLMADTLLYLVVASHPVHVIYNLLFHGLGAPTSHTGFERVKISRKHGVKIGDFYHQIHHRFFDTNYGTLDTPFDAKYGTFHDGTAKSHKLFVKQRKLRRSSK